MYDLSYKKNNKQTKSAHTKKIRVTLSFKLGEETRAKAAPARQRQVATKKLKREAVNSSPIKKSKKDHLKGHNSCTSDKVWKLVRRQLSTLQK